MAKCNLIVISHFLKVTEKIKSSLFVICTMKEKVATGHVLQHEKFQPHIRKKVSSGEWLNTGTSLSTGTVQSPSLEILKTWSNNVLIYLF